MTSLVPWEFVRESILCAFEIEGGDLLFLPLLLFSQNHLLGQRHTGAKARLPPKLCGAVMPANGHVSIYGDLSNRRWWALSLPRWSFAWAGKGRREVGRLERKGRCWERVWEGAWLQRLWAAANLPSQRAQPRDLPQRSVSHLWAPREVVWGHTREDCGSGIIALVKLSFKTVGINILPA